MFAMNAKLALFDDVLVEAPAPACSNVQGLKAAARTFDRLDGHLLSTPRVRLVGEGLSGSATASADPHQSGSIMQLQRVRRGDEAHPQPFGALAGGPMAPVFEIHELAPAGPEEGDTLADILAGIAVMYFVIGTTLFLSGWV